MSKICIGGIGYAGFPIALGFDQSGHDVVGYDIDETKLNALRDGSDPFGVFDDWTVPDANICYTGDPACVESSDYVLVAVPTPIDEQNVPDVSAVRAIGRDLGPYVEPGTTFVLESTIYPGGTREVLASAIEDASGRTSEVDFRIGYSPERVDPGQTFEEFRRTAKVIGAQDDSTLRDLADLYGSVFETVHCATSIETAEAAKCLENTQRDVNIALINEFTMACRAIENLDFESVLSAAATKWNFHSYEPGLVGGHCVPVDPHYLLHRFEREGRSMPVVRASRATNHQMAEYVADVIIEALSAQRRPTRGISHTTNDDGTGLGSIETGDSILVTGLTYKPNTSDVRSRSIRTIVDRLKESDLNVVGYDPHAKEGELTDYFGIPSQEELSVSGFDALAILTPHDEFYRLDIEDLVCRMAPMPVIVDINGCVEMQVTDNPEYVYESL